MSVLVRHVWHILKNNNTIHNYTPILHFPKLLHFPCPHITPERHRMSAWHKDWQIGVLGLANPKRCATFSSVDGLMDRSLSGERYFLNLAGQVPLIQGKIFQKKQHQASIMTCQSCSWRLNASNVWNIQLLLQGLWVRFNNLPVSIISQYWSGKWFEVARQNSEKTQKYLQ